MATAHPQWPSTLIAPAFGPLVTLTVAGPPRLMLHSACVSPSTPHEQQTYARAKRCWLVGEKDAR